MTGPTIRPARAALPTGAIDGMCMVADEIRWTPVEVGQGRGNSAAVLGRLQAMRSRVSVMDDGFSGEVYPAEAFFAAAYDPVD